MAGGVFLMGDDGKLIQMQEHEYEAEALLQEILANHPQLLAGDQIDPTTPRHWVLVSREVPVPAEEDGPARWALDHLFLDQDGVPTFVEVKRSTNNEIRRKVVGQMLDYAANAQVYWPVESIQEWLKKTCERTGSDSDETLRDLAGEDTDAFWQKVKTNLRAGRVRLMFVADTIPPELLRIVDFLSQQLSVAEVYAVEVKQYMGSGKKTLTSRVVSRSTAKMITLPSDRWDQTSFLAKLQRNCAPAELKAAEQLLEWAEHSPRYVRWGTGRVDGSFTAKVDHNGRDYPLFAVYTYGRVALAFGAYQWRPPFENEAARRQLLAQFNEAYGANLPESAINKYPSIPLSELGEPNRVGKFLKFFESFIQEVKDT
jgi:hypothetical protein